MADFFETAPFTQEPYLLLSESGEDDNEPLIDPRTANYFGAYTEDEIYDDMAETSATAVVANMQEPDIGPVKATIDAQLQQDPELEQDRQSLWDMGKARFKAGDLQSRLFDINFDWMMTQDPNYELERGVVQDELDRHTQSNPDMYDDYGHWDQIVKESLNMGGQLKRQGIEVLEATPKGPAAMGLAGISFPIKQMVGSIYGDLRDYEDEETGITIPHETAKKVAIGMGTPAGAMDLVGQALMASPVGRAINVPTLLATLGSPIGEAGTEGVQTVMENTAKWMAINIEREKAGLEPIELTAEILTENVPEAMKAAAYGAIGLTGGGQVVAQTTKGVAKISTATRKKLETRQQLKQEKLDREAQENNDAIKQSFKTEAAAEKDKQTVSAVDEDGSDLPAADLRPSEVADSHSSGVTKATGINDGFFDDAVIADDPDAFIADVNSAVDGSLSDIEVEVGEALRDILPDEGQARAIDALLTARADSAGMSKTDYLNARVKAIRQETGGGNNAASIRFNEEGQAIIKAFEQADVSSLVHEIGHIFRRDVQGADLQTIENWAGVQDGVWTRAAEEKFARGFEQYMREGRAPNQELQNVFNDLARWMKEIYKTLRNSEIDVDINDDIRSVFDRLLLQGQGVKLDLEGRIQDEMTLFQQKNRAKKQAPVDPVAKAEFDALVESIYGKMAKKQLRPEAPLKLREILDATRGKKMGPKKTFDMQMRALHRIMKDTFDRGDKVGYARAKAEGKAIIARERQRRMARERAKGIEKRFNRTFNAALKRGAMAAEDTDLVKEMKTLFDEVHSMNRRQLMEFHSDLVVNAKDPADITPAESLRNAYVDLKVRAIDANGVANLNDFYKQIRDYTRGARYDAPFMQMIRAARGINAASYADVAGPGVHPNNIRSIEEAKRLHKERFKRELRDPKKWKELVGRNTVGKWWLFGWNGLMELITSHTPIEKGRSQIQDAADFHRNEQARDTQVREKYEGMTNALMELHGLPIEDKPGWFMIKELNKRVNLDLKRDLDIGMSTPHSMSEIRQLWMYLQDPSLRNRLYNMGINDQVEKNINDMMNAGEGNHRKFAQWMLEQFQNDDNYNQINEVHRRLYGHDLPRLPNYVPVISEAQMNAVQQQREETEIVPRFRLDTVTRQTAESSGRLKDRNKEIYDAPLVISGDIGLYMGYNHEMAHFVHMSEQLRLVNTMFKDKNLQKLIVLEYGEQLPTYIKRHFTDIQANGTNYANTVPTLDKIRSAFVTSSIGMSGGVMAKQLISIVNFWQHIPTKNYIKYMTQLVTDMPETKRIMQALYQSDFMKNRQGGIERDLQQAVMSPEFKRFQLNPSWQNLATLNVKIGDNLAIAFGGVALYKEQRAKGMSHDEAIFEVGRLADQTQQSRSILEQSGLQRAGSMAKWVTTYSTGPIQAVRQEALALRGWANGRVTKKQAAKTMLIYHVLVPSMYSLAASLISGDDMDETLSNLYLSWMVGPMASMYHVGRSITNGFKRVFGMRYYQNAGPVNDLVMDVARVGADLVKGDWDEVTMDELAAAIQALMVATGRGLPLQRMTRMVQNATQGDVKGAVLGTKPEEQ